MRMWITLALMLAAPCGALAQSRPDTLALTCAQAQDMVRKSGALVLGTGPNVYDRYVSGANFCGPGEIARPQFVRSKDNPSCMPGYICTPSNRSN